MCDTKEMEHEGIGSNTTFDDELLQLTHLTMLVNNMAKTNLLR